MNMLCCKCNSKVEIENESIEYSYYCPNCDKNLYSFEVYDRNKKDEIKSIERINANDILEISKNSLPNNIIEIINKTYKEIESAAKAGKRKITIYHTPFEYKDEIMRELNENGFNTTENMNNRIRRITISW